MMMMMMIPCIRGLILLHEPRNALSVRHVLLVRKCADYNKHASFGETHNSLIVFKALVFPSTFICVLFYKRK